LRAALSAALSPDGTKLAVYHFSKGQNIAVYELAAKRLDLVTNYEWDKNDPITFYAQWSPDGKEIAFLQHGSGDTLERSWAELVASTLEGKIRILYRVENWNDGIPAPFDWMDDGSAIVTVLANPANLTGTLGLVNRRLPTPHRMGAISSSRMAKKMENTIFISSAGIKSSRSYPTILQMILRRGGHPTENTSCF